jgi:hypothetical protein
MAAALDTFVVWGVYRIFRDEKMSEREIAAGLALVFLPFFRLTDHVRLNLEHLSTIAFWAGILAWQNRQFFWLGFAGIATGAFRYPSVLFSVGAFLAIAPQVRDKKNWVQLLCGAGVGLVVFGLADWIAYGRPWESFWMYFQYNALTGVSEELFGKQGIQEYLDWFKGRWLDKIIWAPWIPLLAWGIFEWLRKEKLRAFQSPLAIGTLVYGIGHLGAGHKEGRFMIPLEPALLCLAWMGLVYAMKSRPWLKRIYFPAFSIVIILNFFPTVRAAFDSMFKPQRQVLRLYRDLRPGEALARVCEIYIADHMKSSSAGSFMRSRLPENVPYRIGLYWHHDPGIMWIQSRADCPPENDLALVQINKKEMTYLAMPPSCSIAPIWGQSLSGPWWLCPRESAKNEVIAPLVCGTNHDPRCIKNVPIGPFFRGFPPIDHLPPWNRIEARSQIRGILERFNAALGAPIYVIPESPPSS